MSYACELWSHRHLPVAVRRHRESLGQLHDKHLRSICGVRFNTPSAVLHEEVGGAPLSHVWWAQFVRFWNVLAVQPLESLHKRIAIDDCHDAVALDVRNWAHGFMRQVRDLGFAFEIRCDAMEVVPWPVVRDLLRQRAASVFAGLPLSPRTCPSSGAFLCVYARWFARPAWVPARRCPAMLPVSAARLRAFLRFRTSCHALPVDLGRRTVTPRLLRVCAVCNSGMLGDERHLVFECPALVPLRASYASLFSGPTQTMQQFMWQHDTLSVVAFVCEALLVLTTEHVVDDDDVTSRQP